MQLCSVTLSLTLTGRKKNCDMVIGNRPFKTTFHPRLLTTLKRRTIANFLPFILFYVKQMLQFKPHICCGQNSSIFWPTEDAQRLFFRDRTNFLQTVTTLESLNILLLYHLLPITFRDARWRLRIMESL